MKTAGRIVSTAALLDGLSAQDSPIYGAERRGAPMTAYVRISKDAIHERGVIPSPDLVVVGDDTLLDEMAVRPLAGLPPTGVLLIATACSVEEIRLHTAHPGPIVARDFLGLVLEQVESAAGGSAALGSAACALLGMSERAVATAVSVELAALGLSPGTIRANLRLAELARAGITPVGFPVSLVPSLDEGSPVVDVAYVPPGVGGAPTVSAPANTPLRRTGAWRVLRPVIHLEECTRCWVCFVRCPDGAIRLDALDTPHVDYEVCKGCLICVEECPRLAITTVRQVHRWAPAEVAP